MTGKKSSAQPPPLLCNQHPPPSLPPSKLRAPLLPLPRHHAASRQSRPDRAWRDTRPPPPPYQSAAHSCFLPSPCRRRRRRRIPRGPGEACMGSPSARPNAQARWGRWRKRRRRTAGQLSQREFRGEREGVRPAACERASVRQSGMDEEERKGGRAGV